MKSTAGGREVQRAYMVQALTDRVLGPRCFVEILNLRKCAHSKAKTLKCDSGLLLELGVDPSYSNRQEVMLTWHKLCGHTHVLIKKP